MLKFSSFLPPEITVALLKGAIIASANNQSTISLQTTGAPMLGKVFGTAASPLNVSYERMYAHRLQSLSPSQLQHIDPKTFDFRCANCGKTFEKFEGYCSHINLVRVL